MRAVVTKIHCQGRKPRCRPTCVTLSCVTGLSVHRQWREMTLMLSLLGAVCGGRGRGRRVRDQVLLWPWDPQPLPQRLGVSEHSPLAEVALSDQVLFGPDICRMRQNTDVGMLTKMLSEMQGTIGPDSLRYSWDARDQPWAQPGVLGGPSPQASPRWAMSSLQLGQVPYVG